MRFENLDGKMHHYGAGLNVSFERDCGWLGMHRWVGGLLWETIERRDYRLDYQVLEGASAGLRGQIDFDADYRHITQFVGLELPRRGTHWAFSPHALITWPVPRRGVTGHITGPGFDLRGNTEDVGNGKHFGDPFAHARINRYLFAGESLVRYRRIGHSAPFRAFDSRRCGVKLGREFPMAVLIRFQIPTRIPSFLPR